LYLGAGFDGVSHEGGNLVEHIIPTFPQIEEVLGENLRYYKMLFKGKLRRMCKLPRKVTINMHSLKCI
jgi:hypothetical protein